MGYAVVERRRRSRRMQLTLRDPEVPQAASGDREIVATLVEYFMKGYNSGYLPEGSTASASMLPALFCVPDHGETPRAWDLEAPLVSKCGRNGLNVTRPCGPISCNYAVGSRV